MAKMIQRTTEWCHNIRLKNQAVRVEALRCSGRRRGATAKLAAT
jgi:hypothetical protein